ncbi:MAG: response regulator, partial [Phycisphaerae bacterium]
MWLLRAHRRPRGFIFRFSFLFVLALGVPCSLHAQQNEAQGSADVTVPADASVESLFVDFLHYAKLGRFTIAEAYAQRLLTHPDLDPVEVLDVANRYKKSIDTLLIIIEKSSIGDSAASVLELIEQGERLQRRAPDRIRANIEHLMGDPQQQYFGIARLAESGEYAIPPMVAVLLDPQRSDLRPGVITALGRMGKAAVQPLSVSLAVNDNDVRGYLIRALGEIGYPLALPYLHKLIADAALPDTIKEAAGQAVDRIHAITGRTTPGTAADLFYQLGEKYYNEDDSVRADPREDTANVWYWDKDTQALKAVVVPQRIFGPVMAMRCCEEALLLQNDHAEAIALWLAANIRRESRLGLDIESGDPSESAEVDATRPGVFPRALYFSQASGARYAHLVLARAVRDEDTVVALGAIESLRVTAGASSLVGREDVKQPLVQALRFPDALVRVRAALALGAALPNSPFAESQFVVPVLAGAISLTGREQVLVVDREESNLNRVAAALRAAGPEVIGGTDLYRVLERARTEFQALTALLISSDVSEPDLGSALGQFRSEFMYAKTPVVVLVKPGQSLLAEEVASADRFVELVDADAADLDIAAALERARLRAGKAHIDEDLALELALQAVETLRRIAVDGRTVYDVAVAEPALTSALSSSNNELQTRAASVLALVHTPSAQRAVATMALDANNDESLRISAFASLSESAKKFGNLLVEDQLDALVGVAR